MGKNNGKKKERTEFARRTFIMRKLDNELEKEKQKNKYTNNK